MRRATSQAVKVTVRMYRRFLGDCFLLTFAGGGDSEKRFVLIDCGIAATTSDEQRLMREVAEDIRETTKSDEYPRGHLHAVAATHEHYDHVIGFLHAQDIFEAMQVDHVLLSWAENPRDKAAKALKAEYGRAAEALRLLANKLGADRPAEAGDKPISDALRSFVGMHGTAAAAGGTTEAAMKVVAHLGPPDYLKPGQVLELPEVEGVRIYVLGPPRDEKWIKRLDSTKETYQAALTLENAFLAAAVEARGLEVGESSATWKEDRELTFPFASPYRIPLQAEEGTKRPDAEREKALREGFLKPYWEETWRAIADDWLDAAGEIALFLKDKTNNTSLVLAFEIEATNQVLLFAGDAQVGNWLSWDTVDWRPKVAGEEGEPSLAEQLLNRTAFYKVGHHGSHNATASAKGLERMTSSDLVAMIPVDEAKAKALRYGEMPFGRLVERLEERTGGRLLQSDHDLDLSHWSPPADLSASEWSAFKKAVAANELYVEYTLG